MAVRYRGPSGQVCTYANRIPELDASPRWERVEDVPSESDPKRVWVSYAESLGVDVGGLTKQQIVEACGDR